MNNLLGSFYIVTWIDSGVRPTTRNHCCNNGYCLISAGNESAANLAFVTSCLAYNFINFPYKSIYLKYKEILLCATVVAYYKNLYISYMTYINILLYNT